jgi:hypothetical protein
MRIVVDFQDESLEFEIPPERVVACWRGPEGMGPSDVAAAIGDALEQPRDFPPLRQMIVPGDRVAIAFDPRSRSPGPCSMPWSRSSGGRVSARRRSPSSRRRRH